MTSYALHELDWKDHSGCNLRTADLYPGDGRQVRVVYDEDTGLYNLNPSYNLTEFNAVFWQKDAFEIQCLLYEVMKPRKVSRELSSES